MTTPPKNNKQHRKMVDSTTLRFKKNMLTFEGVEQPVLSGAKKTSVCLVYFQVLRWYTWYFQILPMTSSHPHIRKNSQVTSVPKTVAFPGSKGASRSSWPFNETENWMRNVHDRNHTYRHIDILHLFTDRFIQYYLKSICILSAYLKISLKAIKTYMYIYII